MDEKNFGGGASPPGEQRFDVENRYRAGRLDRGLRRFLWKLEKEQSTPLVEMSAAEARETFNRVITEAWSSRSPSRVASVEDMAVNESFGVRVYTPKGSGPFPAVLFIHGGGWVVCNPDTHDSICRDICRGASAVVVSVDYRLAPEHPFPAPLEDVYEAARWIPRSAGTLNVAADRVAVAGDSAGGNLAAALTLLARERGEPHLAFQLLIYPATDLSTFDTASHREFAEGYLLTRLDMEWYRDHYLGSMDRAADPLVSPLLAADLSALPPAHVVTAEFDPLRDEGEAYARRLFEAGVPATCTRLNGMIHGFANMDGVLGKPGRIMKGLAARLGEELRR